VEGQTPSQLSLAPAHFPAQSRVQAMQPVAVQIQPAEQRWSAATQVHSPSLPQASARSSSWVQSLHASPPAPQRESDGAVTQLVPSQQPAQFSGPQVGAASIVSPPPEPQPGRARTKNSPTDSPTGVACVWRRSMTIEIPLAS
jgi:hypothetical protein